MALIRKHTKRLQHPTEKDAWVELRLPLTAGDLELIRDVTQGGMVTIDLLATVVTGWSYAEPVSRETVKSLDLDTFNWLGQELMVNSGVREEEEKKDSNSSSPAPTEPGVASTRPSSGI